MLEERISQLITYIKDDSRLYDKWALTKAVSIAKGKGYGLFGSDLYKDMQSNREITVRIEKACEDKPEDMEKLLDQAADFDKKRRRKGLSIYSFSRKNTPAKVAGKAFAALLGLPYYIFSAIASAPMWVTYKILKKSVRDRAFHNTVAFGVRLALGFLLLCIYAAITFYTMAWPWALAITLLTIPSYSYFFDYNEGMRRFISDIKVLSDKKMREAYGKLMKSADRIIKQ